MSFPFPSKIMKELTPVLTSDDVMNVILGTSDKEREWLTRLWLSEGVPFAFQNQPALFEASRQWLGERLAIDPKCVTMIGSGRTGFSMKPRQFGRKFNDKSDLDFSIVSKTLFERLKVDAEMWLEDFRKGQILTNQHSKGNYENISSILSRGFLDHWKLPIEKRYKTVYSLSASLATLQANLQEVQEMPPFTKASIRVYKDWSSFARQMEINYRDTVKEALIEPSKIRAAATEEVGS